MHTYLGHDPMILLAYSEDPVHTAHRSSPIRACPEGTFSLGGDHNHQRIAILENKHSKLTMCLLGFLDKTKQASTCKVSMDVADQRGYAIISYLAYSPALALNDYFLFPNLKKRYLWTPFSVR